MLKQLKVFWHKKSKTNKFYFIAVSLVVLVAFFIRSYNLKNSQQFLGDQGRDALIVARIFKDHDPVFIGPVTSVGNMYLGPLYYYWMLPWLWLSYPSPMGPVWAMVVLGVLAVALTYVLGKKLVGREAALIASAILAVMPAAVVLSRFSWNPNPAPLVSLVMIWSTWMAYRYAKKYWLLVALTFSILIQLHYVTLLTLPAAGLVWLFQLYQDLKVKDKKRRKKKLLKLVKYTAFGLLIFLFSLTPLILFDLKHQGLNAKAFVSIMSEKGFESDQAQGLKRLTRALKETHGRSLHIFFEVTVGKVRALNTLMLVSLVGWLGYLIAVKRLFKRYPGFSVVLVYLLVGIVGLSFYTQSVFDHYIAYLYPVAALTLGLAFAELWRFKRWLGALIVSLFLVYESYFLFQTHPWQPAGLTLDEIEETAKLVVQNVPDNEIYNVILLDDTGDLDAFKYRYFLNTLSHPPTRRDERDKAKLLFIIDERSDRQTQKATDSPAYEIVVFPNKTPIKHLVGPDGQDIWVLKKD